MRRARNGRDRGPSPIQLDVAHRVVAPIRHVEVVAGGVQRQSDGKAKSGLPRGTPITVTAARASAGDAGVFQLPALRFAIHGQSSQ